MWGRDHQKDMDCGGEEGQGRRHEPQKKEEMARELSNSAVREALSARL